MQTNLFDIQIFRQISDLFSHFRALLRKHLLKQAAEEQPLGKGTVAPVEGDTGARAGPHVDGGVEA